MAISIPDSIKHQVDPFLIAGINPGWTVETGTNRPYFYNSQSGAKIYSNQTAAAIVALVDSRHTVSHIAAKLGAIFHTDPYAILPDISEALQILGKHDVISFCNTDNIVQRLALFENLPSYYKPDATHENPFDFFDAIFCINMERDVARWQEMRVRFKKIGILDRVIRFPAVETPLSHHVGCTLGHRQLVCLANQHKLNNILVFEDDALMLDTLLDRLTNSLSELEKFDWNLFYLGGCLRHNADREIANTKHLKKAISLTCTHAVAYSFRAYEQILQDIPPDIIGLLPWLEHNAAIDQYLTNRVKEGYLAYPTLSAQPITLCWEQPELVEHYS